MEEMMVNFGPRKPTAPEQGFAAGSETWDRNDQLVDLTQLGRLWSVAVVFWDHLDM